MEKNTFAKAVMVFGVRTGITSGLAAIIVGIT
jgi:hypothetical protein